MVNSAGIIKTFAGTGTQGSIGDGGAATSAQLNGPTGVSADISGNVYISDNYNQKIRMVTSAGIIKTFAGTWTQGSSGDGGAATSAQLKYPHGVSVDIRGNVYISDNGNNKIRLVVQPCAAGSYSATGRPSPQSSCLSCALGTYSSAGATACQICIAGSYSSTIGSTTCSFCPSGSTTVTTGTTSGFACTLCSSGYWSSTAVPPCTACVGGTYNPSIGSTSSSSCLSCASGTYNPNSGSTSISSCQSCAVGTYNPITSSAACLACSSGFYSSTAGSTVCLQCGAGTYSTGSASSCQPCAVGTYNPNIGSTSSSACLACSSGFYSPATGSTVCLPCGAGTYSAGSASSCQSCAVGTYNPNSASTSSSACLACSSGFYSSTAGSTVCQPCGAGTYSTASTSSCQPCADGTYNPNSASSACQACLTGYTGGVGASSCSMTEVYIAMVVILVIFGFASLVYGSTKMYSQFQKATVVAREEKMRQESAEAAMIQEVKDAAARKVKEERQRTEAVAATEALRVQREKERIENERLEVIRVAEEAVRKQREEDQKAKERTEEAERRRQAAATEEARQQREKEQAALTSELFDDFEALSQVYPIALKYQKMTVNAKAALLAGDLDLAWKISAQHHALHYTPEEESSVDDILGNLLELKRRLLIREVEQTNDATSSVSFEYAEICHLYLDKVQKLVGSRVDAGDLKIIPWSELSPYPGYSELGKGQFGTAYKLLWSNQPVAVKVVSFEKCDFNGKNYDVELLRSVQEAERVVDICNRGGIGIDELVIKVYGFVEGPITSALEPSLDLPAGDKAFGIVMRLEAGGTLRERLYGLPGVPPMPLTITEKLRFIQQITQGLFELHKMGVIHADLKPANTLLSGKNPPDCRLADFGQSFVREDAATRLGVSTFQYTSAARGTPVYSAPEMLSIYNDDEEGLAGKACRSTDVYALGIMMHEILSMQEPFKGLSEVMLARNVCGGGRPPLDQLPNNTPPAVRALMEKCWDGDRNHRPSGAECLSIMTHNLSVMESSHFDIFFSYSHSKKPFVVHLFDVFTKLGFRVWLDQNNLGHNMTASMQEGIEKSTVMMSFVDQNYQQSMNCQEELQYARNVAKKPVVVVIVEGNFWS